jgi:hypothetical protein
MRNGSGKFERLTQKLKLWFTGYNAKVAEID